MERILKQDPQLESRGRRRANPDDIRAIIISPTRELAEQIGAEAARLASRTGIKVQLAVGGTMKNMMLRKVQSEGCHLLVGTPGRLRDILSDEYSRVRAPLLNTFVLDEADRLLDAGFSAEIEDIKSLLPNSMQIQRQTMLFSATIHPDIVNLVRRTLRPGFKFVQCVRPDEEQTHERVPQKLVRLGGLENQMPALVELCKREMEASMAGEKKPFKAMIFYNSTAEVSLARETLDSMRGPDGRNLMSPASIIEIHSKLSQGQRTRASESFRRATSAVLLTTDVTARGMDFPDVTHVIQVGLPQNSDSYVHRLGRTARAGKEGEGWLFISPLEEKEARSRLREMKNLKQDASLQTAHVNMAEPASMPAEIAHTINIVTEAYKGADPESLEKVYRAGLGVFLKWAAKDRTISSLNALSQLGWGMKSPPRISASLASKLGYAGVRGINIGHSSSGGSSFEGGRGGGFGSSSRRGFSDRNNDPFGSRDGSFPPRRSSHDASIRGDRGDRGDRGGNAFSRGGGRRAFDRGDRQRSTSSTW